MGALQWDSADELILKHLTETLPAEQRARQRFLVVNDHGGILSYGLVNVDVTAYTDSYMSAQEIERTTAGKVRPLHRLDDLSGIYDVVLIKLPKNTSFLEDTLCHLSGHLQPGSKVIGGYMLKYESRTSFELLKKYIGDTTTSLAQKRARLILADFQRERCASPYPVEVAIDKFQIPFTHHSNLFSREKLDIGTRFFLEHIPQGDFRAILDLGCANGVVGIAAKMKNPSAKVVFSDESFMATESARINFRKFFAESECAADFCWTHCYKDAPPGSVDLVLCNPPFHLGNAEGHHVAHQMFVDSYRALAEGRTLRVIGNSHLGYPTVLKSLFGNSRVVAENDKFTIVDAVR